MNSWESGVGEIGRDWFMDLDFCGGTYMINKIKFILLVIGIFLSLIGTPYLLGDSSNNILRYTLYLGLVLTVVFFYPIKSWKGK